MLICQVIELKPTDEQASTFRRHAQAARIAHNDLIALWRGEGQRLPGFRLNKWERRPAVNALKFENHPWMATLSQTAVKGGMIDTEDAIARYHSGQNRRPRFHGKHRPPAFRAGNGTDTVKLDGRRLMLPTRMGGAVKTKEFPMLAVSILVAWRLTTSGACLHRRRCAIPAPPT